MNAVSSLTDVVVDVIPAIKCRQESLTLMSLSLSCIQLNAAVEGHIAVFDHRRELARLYAKAFASEKSYQQSIAPMLQDARDALELRVNVSEKTLNDILYKITLFQQSISQYQEQNRALSTELSRSGLSELAGTKLFIADRELDICGFIENILKLASVPLDINEDKDSPAADGAPDAGCIRSGSSSSVWSSPAAVPRVLPRAAENEGECDEQQLVKRRRHTIDKSLSIMPESISDRNEIITPFTVSDVAVSAHIHATAGTAFGSVGREIAGYSDDKGGPVIQSTIEAANIHATATSDDTSSEHVASTASSDAISSGSTTYCDKSHTHIHSNIIHNQENLSQNEYSELESASNVGGPLMLAENTHRGASSNSHPSMASKKAANINKSRTNYNPININRLAFASQDTNSCSAQPSVELDLSKEITSTPLGTVASADSTQHSGLDDTV